MVDEHNGVTRRVTDFVKDSAHNVWLAGLGFWAKAERNGSEMFEQLVKDGEKIESKVKEKDLFGGRIERTQERVNESITKLENVFDQRMAKTLNKLQIPSRRDIDGLKGQIDEIAENLQRYLDEKR